MHIRNAVKYTILSVLILCVTACGSSVYKVGSNAAQAILAAKTANNRAISEHYEWRDTGKIIKSAKAIEFAGV